MTNEIKKPAPRYEWLDATEQKGAMNRSRAAYLLRAARSRGERIVTEHNSEKHSKLDGCTRRIGTLEIQIPYAERV